MGRTMAYSAGYYRGYMGEQALMGVLTAGSVKIDQVRLKSEVMLTTPLAKKTPSPSRSAWRCLRSPSSRRR